MREIQFEEFKVRANKILRFVKSVCESHNIKFYLAFGTALGAVRHKGFIPWDDDIDVVMFRKDYEQFCNVMDSEPDDHFKLLSIDNSSHYALPLAKVIDTDTIVSQCAQKEKTKLGVWVDIFVLDYVPDTMDKRKSLYSYLEHIQVFWRQSVYKKNVVLGWGNYSLKSKLFWFIYTPIRAFGARFWAQRLENKAKASNKNVTNTVAILSFSALSSRERQTYPLSYWGNGTKIIFENDEYIVPERYDEYLRFQYGNYMEIPPIEQRIPHHSFSAFAIND